MFSEILFLILRRTKLDMIKIHISLHVKYPYYCPILIKLEFFRHILEKSSNIRFLENKSSGSRIGPYGMMEGQTDRHDGASSRSSKLCERA
jgi:hypothetical protein